MAFQANLTGNLPETVCPRQFRIFHYSHRLVFAAGAVAGLTLHSPEILPGAIFRNGLIMAGRVAGKAPGIGLFGPL